MTRTTLIAAVLATAWVSAQQDPTSAGSIEPVAGRELHRQVTRVVRGLTWHSRLDRAKTFARASDQPIVWIQALGDLDGFT